MTSDFNPPPRARRPGQPSTPPHQPSPPPGQPEPPGKSNGIFAQVGAGLASYWRWTTGGSKWRLAAGIGGPVLALLIVVSALGGSEEENGSDTTAVNKPAAETTSDAPAAAPTIVATSRPANTPTTGPAPLAANQKKIGDLQLTVNAVATHTDRLFAAEAGTYYVAVDVTALNVGTKNYSLNRFNFKLKDSAGYANDAALTSGPEPLIGHHDMVAGQEVRGFLVFKLGTGRTPTELQYQSFTGTPGIIPVTLR